MFHHHHHRHLPLLLLAFTLLLVLLISSNVSSSTPPRRKNSVPSLSELIETAASSPQQFSSLLNLPPSAEKEFLKQATSKSSSLQRQQEGEDPADNKNKKKKKRDEKDMRKIFAKNFFVNQFLSSRVGLPCSSSAYCSVYERTEDSVVDAMVELADLNDKKKGQKLIFDLGSGDGRLVIAAALKCGKDTNSRAIGFERRFDLIEESRENAKLAGLLDLVDDDDKKRERERRVEFRNQDLLTVNFTQEVERFSSSSENGFEVVVLIYLESDFLYALQDKLFEQLPPGSKIILQDYSFDENKYPEGKIVEFSTPYKIQISTRKSTALAKYIVGKEKNSFIPCAKREDGVAIFFAPSRKEKKSSAISKLQKVTVFHRSILTLPISTTSSEKIQFLATLQEVKNHLVSLWLMPFRNVHWETLPKFEIRILRIGDSDYDDDENACGEDQQEEEDHGQEELDDDVILDWTPWKVRRPHLKDVAPYFGFPTWFDLEHPVATPIKLKVETRMVSNNEDL